MNIGIQTWGTEGDVRPFLALAAGLKAAGHQVTLAVTEIRNTDFSSYSDRLRVAVRPVGWIDCPEDRFKQLAHRIFHETNPAKQGRLLLTHFFDPVLEDMLAAAKALCTENDLVIGHFILWPVKIAAVQAGCPLVTVYTTPIIPSPRVAPQGIPDFGKLWNAFWWRVMDAVLNRMWKPAIDRVFRREGVDPGKSLLRDVYPSPGLNLISVSPSLFPPPPDWKGRFHLCGFFNLPAEGEPWRMPDDLRRFLSAGPPPVYMTFGSMLASDPDPRDATALMVSSARRAGIRAIIQSNWEELGQMEADADVYRMARAPHHAVFPHCAAVVHHGGAGTTQASILAGCPSVVVAHASDQPFWGSVLKRAGIAPRILHRRSVTAGKLAAAITRVLSSPEMAERAAGIGRRMKGENGVAKAVELIGCSL